jgi:predicted dehydrogenase
MVINNAQRKIGADNYRDAVKVTRRQVLSGVLAVPGAAGMYWGYGRLEKKDGPVRVGVIGTGDQGRAHIGSMNPDYVQVVAFSDIRPSSQRKARMLLNDKFGEQADGIKFYEEYHKLLEDKGNGVEMVIIALPLHLHAEASLAALGEGKHVLCEKLMAKTVAQCKAMVKAADNAKRMLAIGHQRHYSYLYANCRSIIEQGEALGDIRHIRAYWHRNQTNAADIGDPKALNGDYDGWRGMRPILEEDERINLAKYGYKDLEELVRWRLYDKTGAGLMAELGSHQLDAASIFLGKKHPVAVLGFGNHIYFKDPRDVEDHIFLTFEFGPDASNAVVMYSSIGTNCFDGYGEQVMGTKGTLVVQEEHDAYVFREPKLGEGGNMKDTRVTWAEDRVNRPVAEAGSTAQWVSGADTPDTLTSRGYREEQEHMAWLIRNWDKVKDLQPKRGTPLEEHPENNPDLNIARSVPRCHARVAMADAVIALTANLAMKHQQRIVFDEKWFDAYSDDTPEDKFKA